MYELQGGHLATGKDLTKAPNAFDADRLLKTPARGWFTPTQLRAMERTPLKSSTGHIWIWFDPWSGNNLVRDATTGSSPGNAAAKLIRLMRQYHGLNSKTDHEGQKSREWAASHRDYGRKYQYEYYRSRECRSAPPFVGWRSIHSFPSSIAARQMCADCRAYIRYLLRVVLANYHGHLQSA